jgi:hypothetical protein
MSEEIDYAARVQRGIALMDEKWPDWATEIDLDTLDIGESDRCVTAQYDAFMQKAEDREHVSGWYFEGMKRLGIGDNETYAAHGFNGDYVFEDGEINGVTPGAFDALNGLWKAEIERRRAQGQDAPAEPEASA